MNAKKKKNNSDFIAVLIKSQLIAQHLESWPGRVLKAWEKKNRFKNSQ